MTASARTILHVDMDAFFVSVELLRRPELRGRPVVVGGDGPRGVVAAASYEARSYGVHSAMPAVRATRLCPDAVWLGGDHRAYAEVSARVMATFRDYTPLVEPLSLDEAFLDVSGAGRLHGDGPTIAAAIRERVLDEEGLTCSVGISAVKFVAKMATEDAKPSASRAGPVPGPGIVDVPPGTERAFLAPRPVRELWGVGPKTHDKLRALGIRTIGEIAGAGGSTLVAALGPASGQHLHRLALGLDDRTVEPDRAPKSIGHEETFPVDLVDPAAVHRELVRLSDAVAHRVRRTSGVGRTVTIKVRYGDFRTLTRSRTLVSPVRTGPELLRVARALLDGVDIRPGVRLLGVSVSHLGDDPGQLRLDVDADEPAVSGEWNAVTDATDEIRRRFGVDALRPATLVEPDRDGGGP